MQFSQTLLTSALKRASLTSIVSGGTLTHHWNCVHFCHPVLKWTPPVPLALMAQRNVSPMDPQEVRVSMRQAKL